MSETRRIPTLFYRFSLMALLAMVLGLVVSLVAIAFINSVSWLNDWLLIAPRSRVQVESPWLLMAATLLVPSLGGLLVGLLLQKCSPAGRPLGPPDSIRAVQLRQPLPDQRSG
ncbi:MAG: hypothetical protein R3E89_14440 [Thiolinea sp.]